MVALSMAGRARGATSDAAPPGGSPGVDARAPLPTLDARPEPGGWFAGDIHVHRSCGGAPVSVTSIRNTMVSQDIDFVSLLADMGNGEVQNPTTDLPKVNGLDDPASQSGRILHWDAEWHWDATYFQYPHQALGGHLVCLGLTEAHQVWDESTSAIIAWAHQQGGIAGFAHFQYLDDVLPQDLTCCTPIEYPVEVALGSADFISEDVSGSDAAIHAYYRLLNCGFRPGFAAGSDYPCGSTVGPMLTFARGGTMTYRNWINAIAAGRTVVSRNGRHEFLNLRVNGSATPGDEVSLSGPGTVQISARWTANQTLSRTIEVVKNGLVVASKDANVTSTAADSVVASVNFATSGWLCARVVGPNGHVVHTAAVFVTVNGAPVRASLEDAQFYLHWIDRLIARMSPGGDWNGYFPTELAAAQARYQAARAVFQQIADSFPPDSMMSIWSLGDTPATENVFEGQAVEVGVKFRAAQDGYITGMRFFKGNAASGTHVGHLWSRTGTLLAQATFTNETDVGWQRVAFPSPVAIAANTSYVVSYHSIDWYSETSGYFGAATVNGPLRALADGEDGPNGVYAYTTTTAFPTLSNQSTNYWVDVLFRPADLTPPTVTETVPFADAANVPVDVVVQATFSENVDASTITGETFALVGPGATPISATVAYDAATHTASCTPTAPLADSTTYIATLLGGGSGPRIEDAAGNALAVTVTWSFTTAPESTVGVDPRAPRGLKLTAVPNPARGSLTLSVEAPKGGYEALDVVDVSGRIVRRLGTPTHTPGRWSLRWDGNDDVGQRVRAGVYFAHLRSRNQSVVLRVAIVP
jgi:hypothetical protein